MPPADVYRIVYKIYADTSELKKIEKEIERMERELSRKRGRFAEKEKQDMVARLNALRAEAATIYNRIGKEAAIAQARGYNAEWVRQVAGAKMPIQAHAPLVAAGMNKELLQANLQNTRRYISQALIPLQRELGFLNRLLIISAYRFREFEFGMFSVMFGGWMLQWTFQGMAESYLQYYYTVTQGNTKISRSLMGIAADWNYVKFLIGESLGKIVEKFKPVLESMMEFAEKHPDLVAAFIALTVVLGGVALWAGIAYMASKILWGAIFGVLSVLKGLSFANPLLTAISLALLGVGILIRTIFGTTLVGTLKMAWNSLMSFSVAFLAAVATIVGKFVSMILAPVEKMLSAAKTVADLLGFDTSPYDKALKVIRGVRRFAGVGMKDWYLRGMALARPFMLEMNRSDFTSEENYMNFTQRYGGIVPVSGGGPIEGAGGGDIFNIQIIAPPDSNLPEEIARALQLTIMANSKRTY